MAKLDLTHTLHKHRADPEKKEPLIHSIKDERDRGTH